jgi:NADH-quinone oxidoreductase subunit M
LGFNYLSWIVFLPAAGAILIAFLPAISEWAIKRIAGVVTFFSLVISIFAFINFDRSLGVIQFEENFSWIPAINAHYHLGVDGLSLPLVVLMTLLGFLVVLISWKIDLRPREYFAWLLLLETSILGVFCSLDLLLFFLFWEIEVIPMYFLISIWGTGRKEYSAIKYVVYTLFGSAMMLAGILSLYFTTGSLNMVEIARGGLAMVQSMMPAGVIFLLLLIGFAVKLPVFPLHTWLPDAHTDAPTAVSVILAGALLKMGGYGMIRISVSSSRSCSADAAGTNISGAETASAAASRSIMDGARSSRAATSSAGSPARRATSEMNSLSITVHPRRSATSWATSEPPAPYWRVIVMTAIRLSAGGGCSAAS